MNQQQWQQAALYRYQLPFTQPLRFNGIECTHRDGLLLALQHADGQWCWGECAPLPGFSIESIEQASAQLQQQLPLLLRQQQYYQPEQATLFPSVRFALSCALSRLTPQLPVTNTRQLLQGQRNTISSALSKISSRHVKLKVGRADPKEELALIQSLLTTNPDIELTLDSNQCWTLNDAINFANQLPKDRISYIEEPLKPTSEHDTQLEQFFAQTRIPYALDETVQQPGYQFKKLSGLKMLIIKPTLIGGVKQCQKLINSAKKAGIASSLSASFESDLGVGQLNKLAEILTPDEIPGLDTLSYLQEKLWQHNGPDNNKITLLKRFSRN